MKLIIDIPDTTYAFVKQLQWISAGRGNCKTIQHTVINAIKFGVPIQDEWISVDERLPEDMVKVLVWFECYRYGDFNCVYQTYGFGYVCDGKWSDFINGETGWQDARIIAWQPLPEPYMRGKEK